MDVIKKNTEREVRRPFLLPNTERDSSDTPSSLKASPPKKRRHFRFLLSFISLCLLIFGIAFLFLYKGVRLGQSMQFENTAHQSFITQLKHLTGRFFSSQTILLRGEEEGRVNILLLGRAGEHYPGRNLTDTIMIMSIDTTTKQVALLSLPRDLYVPIADSDLYTKLNSLYQYGLSQKEGTALIEQTIEAITSTPIHYFITLDFDGFEKIVDTLGGVSVDVPRDFYDPRYPGKNYSYETFEIKKGWQTLDGATALKYVRERHDDPAGDFGRAKRQQQVIQAIKNKAFSLGTFFYTNTLNRLIDTLGESIKTNMSLDDMTRFLELSRTIDTTNVTTVVIDAWKKESLLRVSHIQVGDIAAFILVPRVGNWSELKDVSENIFHRDEKEKRKQAIIDEKATVTLFFAKTDSAASKRLATLLEEELGFAMVDILPLPVFHNRPEKSIIVEQSRLTKPFSLDELLKKFTLEKTTALPFPSLSGTDNDYSIIIGKDLAEILTLSEGDTELNTRDDTSFSEPLPPQPKQKKK